MPARFVVAVCILSTASPAFAQLDRSSLGAAHQYEPVTSVLSVPFTLPSNLHVAATYRGLVESMADRSLTFRRQLLRIATAPRVTVNVELIPSTHIGGSRARTGMKRQAERLIARIEVARLDNVVELIAHEIEHVIEQLDGIDLAEFAALPETGVYSLTAHAHGTVFESVRSIRVGMNVAREVRASGRRIE
jgi:hypothetical protein